MKGFKIIAAVALLLPAASFAQYGAPQSAYRSSYATPRATNSAYQSSYSNPSSEHVSGYTRANGTYVQPYERTTPNSTRRDNYNTQGNVNPYTGAVGTESDEDGQ